MYFPPFIGQLQPLPQNCFRALVIQADALPNGLKAFGCYAAAPKF